MQVAAVSRGARLRLAYVVASGGSRGPLAFGGTDGAALAELGSITPVRRGGSESSRRSPRAWLAVAAGPAGCRRFGSAAAAAEHPWTCAGCGKQHSSFAFICGACGGIAEASYTGISHFQMFGLEPRFILDLTEVDNAYKDLQRKLHPDRHANAAEHERELVDMHSARVNEAVSTLRSPLLRAGYWMELHGVRVLEEDQRMEDMATMMEVMEISEELEEATTQSQVDALTADNVAKMATIEAELDGCFRTEDWAAARPLVERLQMLTRLKERMDGWSPA